MQTIKGISKANDTFSFAAKFVAVFAALTDYDNSTGTADIQNE